MEGATADQLPGALGKQWVIPPSQEEASVQRWIDAFQAILCQAQDSHYADIHCRAEISNCTCHPKMLADPLLSCLHCSSADHADAPPHKL